ncbi:hypothetical protein HC031_19705 [Planosporangium thailandense]|uniref:WXG100 family type VII secretion target n=1 Tax=Planosporangium thailandense TaxID=765197 RepID=A0ABX0Y0P9_9ACTN|nr:hypothetical protein [Planosporangium thailandense]NJC71924.1 hypothetical protein [Planosporangium thailandense]
MGSTTAYPNLGFDPCPGSLESVSTLQQRIASAAASMRQANDLMNRLRNDNSGVWQGAAGEAFRSHLNATLIDDLGRANQSLNKAVETLQGWGSSLSGYKQRADALEQQAAQAQQKVTAAQARQRKAASSPDLNLAGQHFATDAALHSAQQRLDNAALALRNANSDLDAAQEALDHIRKQARELHAEWDQRSSKAAGELRDAAEFTPHQPGLLSRIGNSLSHAVSGVGDWVKNHLSDIHAVLSTVSAIAGLVALCTPPPIDAVAFGVALVAGAGALATTIADPKIRKDLGEMLHGHFAGNWGAAMQLGGDVIGMVPGVGAAGKAIKAGDVLAEGARGFPKIVDIASNAAHDPGILMKTVDKHVPGVQRALVETKLLTPRTAEIAEARADMLNFLHKTYSTGKATVTTVWSEATGGNHN